MTMRNQLVSEKPFSRKAYWQTESATILRGDVSAVTLRLCAKAEEDPCCWRYYRLRASQSVLARASQCLREHA